MEDTRPDFTLSEDDIKVLVRHPDPSARAIAAQRICLSVRETSLSDADRARAYKVLKYISDDVAAMVRRALAITLKNSPELPHDLAVKLINDLDNIAVPVLENSPVLTDEDLIDVLKSRAAAKAMAIARRPSVSGSIVRAIIRFGDSEAVAGIAANDRVPLGEAAYSEILELAASDDLIQESLVKRKDLPPRIVEQLITQASEDIAQRLSERHSLNPELAVALATRTHDRALVDLISQSWVSRDMDALIEQMDKSGRLSSTLIVRAAACGQMRFANHALAVRAGVSAAKASLMIHEPGELGFKALVARAKISPLDVHILRGAIAIFHDLEISGLDYDRAYFQRLMIERCLSLPVDFSDEDGDYLLEILDGLGSQEFK